MERRQFPRRSVYLPIVCKSCDSPLNRATGKTVDISMGGGVGMELNKSFKKREAVAVAIMDRSSGVRVEAEGEVAWCETLASGGGRMGINFTKVAWTKLKDLIGQS